MYNFIHFTLWLCRLKCVHNQQSLLLYTIWNKGIKKRLMNLHTLIYKAIKLYTFCHYSTSKIDDLAQKCMHSAKSTISFGTWYKNVYFLSLYGFVGKSVCKIINLFCCTQYDIKGTRRDWWFWTLHTLFCKIISSWCRVVKDDIQFHTFHFMALQVKVCAESTTSFAVHNVK